MASIILVVPYDYKGECHYKNLKVLQTVYCGGSEVVEVVSCIIRFINYRKYTNELLEASLCFAIVPSPSRTFQSLIRKAKCHL